MHPAASSCCQALMLLPASAVWLAIVVDVSHQLCCFLCLQPLFNMMRHSLVYTLGLCICGQRVSAAMPHGSTPLNPSLPAYSSSKYVRPAITSTARRATKRAKHESMKADKACGHLSVAIKNDPPVIHQPFVSWRRWHQPMLLM